MIFTELQTEIHALTRQEKYRLVQFIVFDLAQQEGSLLANGSVPRRESQQAEPQETLKTQAIDIFLSKWKGSLKGVDPDDAKHQYLQEKYQ
ncbi:MAG: hypothetical protein GY801_10690 [bacterium]|nr:hypothetical protein [bacterium]